MHHAGNLPPLALVLLVVQLPERRTGTGNPQEHHILRTACHAYPAYAIMHLALFLSRANIAVKNHPLLVIGLRVILHIHEPGAIIIKIQINDILGVVKWQLRLLLHKIRQLRLKNHVGTAVHHPHVAPDILLACIVVAAVEDNQLTVAEQIHEAILHILLINLEGLSIDQPHILKIKPFLRHRDIHKIPCIPHAVGLEQNTAGMVLVLQFLIKLRSQLLNILYGNNLGMAFGKELLVDFLLAFLTHNNQVALSLAKLVVGQKVDNHAGLAAFQQAKKVVYRYILLLTHILTLTPCP